MDCHGAGTGNSFRCDSAVHKHGSDGTSIDEGGQCTSSAVHQIIIPASLCQVTPRQGRVDEQVHSCFQGCGERGGEFIG